MRVGLAPPEPRVTARRARFLVQLLCAAVGFAWFACALGVDRLNVTRLDWLSDGDVAAHVLGWLFYRNEPWRVPLGSIASLLHPAGTTVGFADGNPWIAVLLKPVSPWLPTHFQYIGPWLALCFSLQGVFGARLAYCFTHRALHAFLAGSLFVLAPPMVFRIGHDTLTAHWLILAVLWLHLDDALPRTRRLAWLFGLTVFAAGVHPYLSMMVTVLGLALVVQLAARRQLATRPAVATGGCLVLLTAATLALFGYLGQRTELGSGGFGLYSADLLTLINPMGYSRWLPSLPLNNGQHEGFAFLGSGILVLAIAGVGLRWVRREPAAPAAPAMSPVRARLAGHWLALTVAAGLLGFFALSQFVTAGGITVLTLRHFYDGLRDVVAPFRASGRFIWPLHYVAFTAIVASILGLSRYTPRTVAALLLGALVLQGTEVSGAFLRLPAPATWSRVTSPVWDALAPGYRHVALYPPWYAVPPASCEASAQTFPDLIRLSDFAYRNRLTINSAYVARYSLRTLDGYCRALTDAVERGRPADDTIYIVDPTRIEMVRASGSAFTCTTLDGYHVCVSSQSSAARRGVLPQASDGTRTP